MAVTQRWRPSATLTGTPIALLRKCTSTFADKPPFRTTPWERLVHRMPTPQPARQPHDRGSKTPERPACHRDRASARNAVVAQGFSTGSYTMQLRTGWKLPRFLGVGRARRSSFAPCGRRRRARNWSGTNALVCRREGSDGMMVECRAVIGNLLV